MTQTPVIPQIPALSPGEEIVIDLQDFTPGIYADFQAGSAASGAPDGAAQLTGTLGCVGSPNGGLIAAPRIINSFQETRMDSDLTASSDGARTAIGDFRNISPIGPVLYKDPQTPAFYNPLYGYMPTYPDFLWVAFRSFADIGASTINEFTRCIGYKFHTTPVRSTMMFSIRTGDVAGSGIVAPFIYNNSSIEVGRTAQPNLVTSTGPDALVTAFAAAALAGVHTMRVFPGFSPYSFNSVDSANIPASLIAATRLIAHQGRLVGLTPQSVQNSVGAQQGLLGAEHLSATESDDWGTNSFGTSPYVVFSEENPGDIGVIASMNASELVVIKTNGGGYVARGSLADPTIIRLPGLPSTGRAHNKPVNTPFGLIYGSESGVWQFTGGDTAQCLSPQLDGWFWKPHAIVDQFGGVKGSFGYKYPFLFAPNNFIMDQRSGGWWRFGKPSKRAYAWHSPSAVGGVMLCGPTYLDATQTTLCDWFDVNQGCHTYSWVSHPIRRTRGRTHSFGEIILLAQGSGTVTVTLEGIGGTTQTETFTVSSTARPVAIRKVTDMQAADVIVTITSTATATSGTAPRVDRVLVSGKAVIGVPQS